MSLNNRRVELIHEKSATQELADSDHRYLIAIIAKYKIKITQLLIASLKN